MVRDYDRPVWCQVFIPVLCLLLLSWAVSSAQAATIEWHVVGSQPPFIGPTTFSVSPAVPNVTNIINFIAPADGEEAINSVAADDEFGVPLIAIDTTNHIIAVSFTVPAAGAIPLIVDFVAGVDGQIGPLPAGTWTFTILTNSYTFTVAGPPLGISQADRNLVLSWPVTTGNYVLQTAPTLSPAAWSDVTQGVTTNGATCFFTNAATAQAAYFRLQSR